jgi:hypothetical protein
MRVGDRICVWKEGEVFVFDDTFEHEVWNDTDEERVILLFDFDRPMGWLGRLLNNGFLRLLKLTFYYREPLRRMQSLEDRFEAAVRAGRRRSRGHVREHRLDLAGSAGPQAPQARAMIRAFRIFFGAEDTRPWLVLLCLLLAGACEAVGLTTLLPVISHLPTVAASFPSGPTRAASGATSPMRSPPSACPRHWASSSPSWPGPSC